MRWAQQTDRHFVAQSAQEFKPTNLSGLVLWLRADLGVTLNVGNVSAWADQSGAGNNFTQGTGANQPLFQASGFGGRPNVKFSSTGPTTLSKIGFASLNGKTGLTSFIVAKDSDNGAHAIAQCGVADSVFGWRGPWNIANDCGIFIKSQVSNARVVTDLSVPVVVTATADLTLVHQCFCFLNGVDGTFRDVDANPGGTFGTGDFYLGTDQGAGANAWNTGELAEILVYNRVLSAGELSRVNHYLGARYGIAVS